MSLLLGKTGLTYDLEDVDDNEHITVRIDDCVWRTRIIPRVPYLVLLVRVR